MRQRLLLFLLFCPLWVFAAKDSTVVLQGYSGGMMLHAGYLFGDNPNAPHTVDGQLCSPYGVTMGIGGSLRVHLWKHLRAGCEGFVSTMKSHNTNMRNILQDGSYVRSGWGGLIADACWRMEKVWPYVGGAIGGGATHSLYVLEGSQDDWEPEGYTVLSKQSFFYVTPYVGMDWCITKRVHMTFRLDWMVALHDRAIAYPTGPRAFIGFMFCH